MRTGHVLRGGQRIGDGQLTESFVGRKLVGHDAQRRVRLQRNEAGTQNTWHCVRGQQRTLLADLLQLFRGLQQVRFTQQPTPTLQLTVTDASNASDYYAPRLYALRDHAQHEVHQLLQAVPPSRRLLATHPIRNVHIDGHRFKQFAPLIGGHSQQPILVARQAVTAIQDAALLLHHARLAERLCRLLALLLLR